MRRLLLLIAVIFYSSLIALSQINSSSMATGRQGSVQVDSIPLSDKLTTSKPQASGGRSKAALSDHARDSLNERDESESRFWGGVEYIRWQLKKSNLPPLVTAMSGSNGLNANFAIGKPGTVVVLGGSGLERGKFPGSRFTAGLWINKERNAGIEVSYFFLRERAFDFQLGSSGLPGSLGIGIPYIDAIFGGEAAEPIAAPGFSRRGNVAVTSPSTMLGAEANLIYRPRKVHYGRLSLLAGLRYLDLMEQLTLMDTITVPFDNNGTLQKGQLFRTDQFSTRNQFYGAQAGARFDFAYHRLSLKVNGSMALGANRQSVRISGLTSDDADHLTFTGGLLAQVTNIGKYRRHELTVVPDVRANLGYNFNAHFRAFVGYDFLYLNKIVRPDEQIDRVVNFTRAPQPTFHGSSSPLNFGPLRPVFSFIESDFWAQGLSLGIQARF